MQTGSRLNNSNPEWNFFAVHKVNDVRPSVLHFPVDKSDLIYTHVIKEIPKNIRPATNSELLFKSPINNEPKRFTENASLIFVKDEDNEFDCNDKPNFDGNIQPPSVNVHRLSNLMRNDQNLFKEFPVQIPFKNSSLGSIGLGKHLNEWNPGLNEEYPEKVRPQHDTLEPAWIHETPKRIKTTTTNFQNNNLRELPERDVKMARSIPACSAQFSFKKNDLRVLSPQFMDQNDMRSPDHRPSTPIKKGEKQDNFKILPLKNDQEDYQPETSFMSPVRNYKSPEFSTPEKSHMKKSVIGDLSVHQIVNEKFNENGKSPIHRRNPMMDVDYYAENHTLFSDKLMKSNALRHQMQPESQNEKQSRMRCMASEINRNTYFRVAQQHSPELIYNDSIEYMNKFPKFFSKRDQEDLEILSPPGIEITRRRFNSCHAVTEVKNLIKSQPKISANMTPIKVENQTSAQDVISKLNGSEFLNLGKTKMFSDTIHLCNGDFGMIYRTRNKCDQQDYVLKIITKRLQEAAREAQLMGYIRTHCPSIMFE
jgi:hypothetical protein